MQGEKIVEESGKVTSQRVLPNPDGGPKMETSFQASCTLLAVERENESIHKRRLMRHQHLNSNLRGGTNGSSNR
jgi:hypothetical protein